MNPPNRGIIMPPPNRSTEILITRQRKSSNQNCHKHFFLGILLGVLAISAVVGAVLGYRYWRENRWIDVNLCRVDSCGKTGPNFIARRIIGGHLARVDEFPYQVALTLLDGQKVFCGGNMINDRWILTAAHCLRLTGGRQVIKSAIKVSIAIVNVTEVQDNSMDIEDYFVHPKYDPDRGKMYDVALIKTSKSISKASEHFTSPICLPYDDIDSQQVDLATVSGFGTTRENDEEGSDKLRTTKVNLLADTTCLTSYYLNYDPLSMICAGDLRGGEDTCQGDSGGPLAIKNVNGSYVLKGVTSYGAGCGRKDTPGVYTKVSHYLMWTCRKMLNEGLD